MAAVPSPKRSEADALLRRFRSDFEFYAPRALKIKGKGGGIESFYLNRVQRYIHEQIEDQRTRTGKVRKIILKSRQQGVSTLIEGRFYWKASGEFGKAVKILTHLAEATDNLFAMTRRFHEMAPDALKPATRQNSSTSLEFSKLGSVFTVATAGSKETGRGSTAQYFHGSELAFFENANEIMAGIGQIVPNAPGTEIILESTANGVGNFFHGLVMAALEKRSEYELIFVPWMWSPEYAIQPPDEWAPSSEEAEYGDVWECNSSQLYWRHRKIVDDFSGNTSVFDQEYPASLSLAFRRVDGDVFIPIEPVERAMKTMISSGVGASILGIDPAEYGDDSTCFIGRQGRNARRAYKRVHGYSQIAIAGMAMKMVEEGGFDLTNIDVTGGYGSAIADIMEENGCKVNRINFGERAIDDGKYARRSDEMWGEMKDWIGEPGVAIPNDPLLQTELTMRQYSYDSSRRIVLESKEKMRRRGLKSPDGGDALALTFALPSKKVKPLPTTHKFQGGQIGY